MNAISTRWIRSQPNLIRILGWIAVLVSAVLLAAELAPRASRPTYDFHARFTAAHLLAEGQPVAKFYDHEWFDAQAKRFVPGMGEIYGANLPTTALLFSPLALFESEVDARFVWTIISLIVLLFFAEALAQIAGANSTWKPFWYLALLIGQPIQINLFYGQSYLLAGLGLALVLKWWQENRQADAGAMLAGLFAYKSTGIVLWPVAAVTGRFHLLLSLTGAMALIGLVTWPFIGLDGWSAYFNALNELSASPNIRATAYQSVQGILRHVLSEGTDFGVPIVALPDAMARGISTAVALGFAAATLYTAAHHRDDELVVGASLLLWLFIMPVSQAHTYAIAFIPIAQLFRRLPSAEFCWEAAALWFGAAAIILPTPYLSPRLHDGWAAIVAYPKLYGAVVLWALCIMLVVQARTRSNRVPNQIEVAPGHFVAEHDSE